MAAGLRTRLPFFVKRPFFGIEYLVCAPESVLGAPADQRGGAISPQLASRTGFSDEDAGIIKGILPKLFESDSSAVRPDGSMRVLWVVWKDHGYSNGKVSSAKVQSSIKITPRNGNIEITEIENGPKYEILPGF